VDGQPTAVRQPGLGRLQSVNDQVHYSGVFRDHRGLRSTGGSVKLVKVVQIACSSGGCPTIFATGDDVIVQGYAVDSAEAGIDLPEGEMLVRIPRSLLHDGAHRLE
jgi:hypothetical protein